MSHGFLTKYHSSFRPTHRRSSVTTQRRCSLIAPRFDQKYFAIFCKERLTHDTSHA